MLNLSTVIQSKNLHLTVKSRTMYNRTPLSSLTIGQTGLRLRGVLEHQRVAVAGGGMFKNTGVCGSSQRFDVLSDPNTRGVPIFCIGAAARGVTG